MMTKIERKGRKSKRKKEKSMVSGKKEAVERKSQVM